MESKVSEAYAILRRAGIEPEPWAYNWKIADIASQIINTKIAFCNRSSMDYFGYDGPNPQSEANFRLVMLEAKKIVDTACQFRIVTDPYEGK